MRHNNTVETIIRESGDLAAVGTITVTLMGYLPEIAAGLAALWTLIRLGEWFWVRVLRKDQLRTIHKVISDKIEGPSDKKKDEDE